MYLKGSPYRDAEGPSQLRSCLHDEIINDAARIGKQIDKLKFYVQYTPRRVKETKIKELEKWECVSSVMNIAPVLTIEREKNGTMGIVPKIDDGVYVWICTIYTENLKQFTQNAFVYDIHFLTKKNSEWWGKIIDSRSYAPIYVLEEKDRKRKNTLKNMLMSFFEGKCIMKYEFKVTAHYYP